MPNEKKEPSYEELLKTIGELAEKLPKPRPGEASFPWGGLGVGTPDALAKLLESIRAQYQAEAAKTGRVDSDLANTWFTSHWPQPRKCTVCGVDDQWGLVPQFLYLSMGPVGAQLRSRTYPSVAVTCQNCGHTIFFNAVAMGLLPKGEE